MVESSYSQSTPPFRANKSLVQLPAIDIDSDSPTELTLDVTMPKDFEFNKDAPSDLVIQKGGSVLSQTRVHGLQSKLTISSLCTDGMFTAESSLFYCSVIDKGCRIKSFHFDQPCRAVKGGKTAVSLPAVLN